MAIKPIHIVDRSKFSKGSITVEENDEDDEDTKTESLEYNGSRFRLLANPNNELEVRIINAISHNPDLQERLEFSEPNRKYHTEFLGLLGIHIENGIRYIRSMSRYKGWKKYEHILVPAFLLHDLSKKDEEFYGFDERGHPKIPHQRLAYEMAQTLLEITNTQVLNIILHHDDHYRLYRDRDYYKDSTIKHFKFYLENLGREELEMLVKFGYADRYRKKPEKRNELKKYFPLKKLFKNQMEWFINTAKESNLLNKDFEPFS